jgi:hypothetical protein
MTRSVQLSTAFHHGQDSNSMPQWMIDRLDRAGWIDASTGAGRRARAAHCPGCRKPVLRGLTAFPGAISVDCDPPPLSSTAEALCLLVGRRTYELRYIGVEYDLDVRDQWRRRERPAGVTPKVDVLALHVCGSPPLGPYATSMLAEPAPKLDNIGNAIPF